jgi:glutathione S-transferase
LHAHCHERRAWPPGCDRRAALWGPLSPEGVALRLVYLSHTIVIELYLDRANRRRYKETMEKMQIVGRRGSHFTRMVLMFAEELDVPYELEPIYDMTALGADAYANNPALKLPILRRSGGVLFGAQNICRAIAEAADARSRIVWPEDLRDDLSRNAQELVWHSMAAQVQLIIGTVIGKLPADNVFFAKTRAGIEGSLEWLDRHLADVLARLPVERRLSVFEVSLFCLIQHLEWRATVAVDQRASLVEFARAFSSKPSALRTVYAFDVREGKPASTPATGVRARD